MELLDNIATLVTRGWHYWRTDTARTERSHWWHDTMHGATVQPKNPDYVYTDLHVHVFDTQDVGKLVEEAAQRVDVMALVEREKKDNTYHLTFDSFVEKLDAKGVVYNYIGENTVRVTTPTGPLYVIRSIEVYTHDSGYPRGTVIVGNNQSYDRWHKEPVFLDDVVCAAEDMNAFWFLDHEGSKKAPPLGFRPPKEREVEEDKAVYRKLKDRSQGTRPVLEIRNLVNALWQYTTNFIPEEIANELELAGIANSDAHFNIQDIGLSRTGIPRELMDMSSEDAILASLNTAIVPKHKNALLIDGNYASVWAFTPYMLLTNLPVLGYYFMNRLRRNHALEDLVEHSTTLGEELASRYASVEKVRERLQEYNAADSLVVIDIDDCVRNSPAKNMAFKQGWRYAPFRTLKWLFYDGPVAAVRDILTHRSIKDGETKAFAAYRENVVRNLDDVKRRLLAASSMTPLYERAEDSVRYFGDAQKILVSRNIREIVEKTQQELCCDASYWEQDDKVTVILNQAQERNVKRLLIFGDSKEDALPIPALRAAGYHVDFIYVQEKYVKKEIHPDATIAITRASFGALYSLLQRT